RVPPASARTADSGSLIRSSRVPAVGGAGHSGTPPTLGITRPAWHRPSGHKLSRPPMPQGLSAHPPTAYPARPGGRPAQRRPAARLTTRKRAPGKTPRPAPPFAASPLRARRRQNRSTAANSRGQQHQARRAASPTTTASAASSRTDPRLPELAILREPTNRRPAPSGTPYSASLYAALGLESGHSP